MGFKPVTVGPQSNALITSRGGHTHRDCSHVQLRPGSKSGQQVKGYLILALVKRSRTILVT